MKHCFCLLLASLLLTGCATRYKAMETDLYFGLSMNNGKIIAEDDWKAFENNYVAPVFPNGFTRINASGVWRGNNGTTISEPSRVIVAINKMSPQLSAAIDSLRRTYQKLFQQEAVLRVDKRVHMQL